MKNIAVISLGCDKNRVDTEHMIYKIVSAGYSVSDINDAEVIIVNTCAFIESARQESIDNILECAKLKTDGKCEKLIVTGCLPQKHRTELINALPEVDAFLGAFEYDRILQAIEDDDFTLKTLNDEHNLSALDYDAFSESENCGRMLTTYPHVAYVKIAEGCNNRCTFCTIPAIRGAYRSRALTDIVAEAEGLVKDGVKELVLVAQDVTRYGADIGTSLVELLTNLEKLDVSLIRLLYCYPEAVTDELINKIATSDKIAKYIDIPVQHVSNRILKLMNRRTTGEYIENLIYKLHEKNIVVRTTLMVGFPGEEKEDFDELCSFVKRVKPDYAGVFAYSKEAGTPSLLLPGHLKKSEKLKRVNALGKICTDVTRAFNKSQVGKTLRVLYEDIDYDKEMFVGRAEFQTPDVDGVVYFKADSADVGKFYDVKITGSDNYDLFGICVNGDKTE